MKPAYTEKLLARHVRFLNPDLIEIHRPMMQIWRLIIIVIGLLLAFISWVKHADTIYTRDDTFVTYVKWFIQPSTERHKAYLQYVEEQIKENQALEAQLKELAKGSTLPTSFIEFRKHHADLDYFSAQTKWNNYLELQQKLAKNSVQSEQEYYQSYERYTFEVKRQVALSLIGFPLAAFFISLLLPNQRLIRIDRRRRMIYVKDDQFYIHQLPEWTVYDDIEKVNLPLFLSHEGLHFVLPDSKMKELYLVKVGRLGLINIQGLQMFIQDFLSGKYIHFAHTTSAKSWNILDLLLGKAFYSDKYTSEEIEKAIENYQKNWVNLSFKEQKVLAEKLYQDMKEKLQNKISNLKIILGIIMLIYAIFHLLRAFRLA